MEMKMEKLAKWWKWISNRVSDIVQDEDIKYVKQWDSACEQKLCSI